MFVYPAKLYGSVLIIYGTADVQKYAARNGEGGGEKF